MQKNIAHHLHSNQCWVDVEPLKQLALTHDQPAVHTSTPVTSVEAFESDDGEIIFVIGKYKHKTSSSLCYLLMTDDKYPVHTSNGLYNM